MSKAFQVIPTGDWKGPIKQLDNIHRNFVSVARLFVMSEAHRLRGLIIKSFDNQGYERWKPLSPWTLAIRRFKGFSGTKALIHSGELRKSVVTKFTKRGLNAFVGVLYKTKRKDGKSMVNIAKVHEYGVKPYVVKITPKMRRFLFLVGTSQGLISKNSIPKSSKGFMIISIPARPFMRPAFKVFQKSIQKNAKRFFSRY